MSAVVIRLPDPAPERLALLRRQARVEMDRLWSLYRHALDDLARCPCDLHRAKADRAFRAWMVYRDALMRDGRAG